MANSSSLLAAAVKRLLHDLREVRENPMPNVSCLPLEDDLFTWHGNVRSGPDGSLKGAPIHFILSFPHDYPHEQPECRLLQPIPHPNVKPATSSGTIHVLHANSNTQQLPTGVVAGSAAACRPHPIPRQARWRLSLWDCIPGKNSWSTAYSVLSVMLQLQVFLLDEDLQYDHQQVTPERAIAKALELDCPDCSHAGSDSNIHPSFASAADLAAAKSLRAKQAVAKPFVPARSRTTALYLKAHQKEVQVQGQKQPAPQAAAAASSSAGSTCGRSSSYSAATGSRISSSSSSCTAAVGSACSSSCSSSVNGDDHSSSEHQWVTVRGKGKASSRHTAGSAARGHTCAAGLLAGKETRFAVLQTAKQLQHHQQQQQQQPMVAAAPIPPVPGQSEQQQQLLSKAAKKNLARTRKRQQAVAPCAPAAPARAAKAPAPLTGSSKALQPASAAISTDVWVAAYAKAAKQQAKVQLCGSPLQQQLQDLQQQPMNLLIQQCLAGDSFKAPATAADGHACSTSGLVDLWSQRQHYISPAATAAGPFSCLPQDALLCILGQLSAADVANLSQSCKALKVATADGAVWQLMMARSFPGARLTASNMADWKAAYLLESGCVLQELSCWYTRADFHEDVLGLPLTYTVNPVTKKVDYILAHPDLISVTAFKAGVKQTPTGEKFDALLPLYLTADHFNRALPHLEPLLRQLAPEHVPRGGGCPPPETWLEVLAKILNTQVVLLADNGITASQRSLAVSCQVYRLLLAVCEHWVLWPKVSTRLDTFLQHPGKRSKSACPNLGLLMPLLSCSPVKHSWSKMSAALLEEALDRKVLWMCKKDPSLVKSFQEPLGSPPHMDLLRGSWAGAMVSCRLTAFHLAFLQLVAAPKGSTLEAVMDSMDAMYGWPAAALGSRFVNVVKRFQQLDGWQSWFPLLGRKIPTAATMSDLLRSAWRRGEKKGYHSANTDFNKIHASGVSRILLKGQSYSTPPGTKSVELEVHYKWKPEFTVRYLDGAVLLFGPDRHFREMIAWNNQRSSTTARPGAVTHSGDIMEFGQQQGLNRAKVVFGELGPDVCEVFITLSAWSDAMLSDIIQPYVQLKEPSTGVELCQCHLDSKDMVVKKAHKCIIMARMYREPAGGWGVQSVGTFCQGNTGMGGFGTMVGNNPNTPLGKMVQGVKAVSL